MTVIDLDTDLLRARAVAARVDVYLAGLGQGFNAYHFRSDILAEALRLSRLDDAALAARGLARDGIVPAAAARAGLGPQPPSQVQNRALRSVGEPHGRSAMTDLPRAGRVLAAGDWAEAADRVVLDYDARFLRRKRLEGQGGLAFLVDLPETLSVDEGMAFALEDGRAVEIVAAPEPLHSVRGDLPRLAWHIGNRHTPCEIGADRLLIRQDHVLRGMLAGLGAEVEDITGPFRPEGGAYGHGRTMGHSHGADHGHVHHHGSHRHLPDDDEEGPPDA